MAKNKRKISASQRDKILIDYAKDLKKAGILSKQANLHSGRYISKGVLAKVRKYKAMVDLDYRAVPATKAQVKAAKERGYETIGGTKIIGPNSQTFRNRIKKGDLTGVKPIKGAYMEEVILPHTVYDMRTLVEQLEEGIDSYKMPDERFAFKFHGHESYRTFPRTKDLLDYLTHYKSIFVETGSLELAKIRPEELQDEFEALTIFRLHPYYEPALIPGPTIRRKRAKDLRSADDRGRTRPRRRKTVAEKMELMHPALAERLRKKLADRSAKQRAKILADPARYEAYKEKAKIRAKKSRENAKKGK